MIDHEKRKYAMGGSEVGSIYGVDEYRSAFGVWARKKGGLIERTEDRDIRMVVGKALEPGVLSLYTYVTGRKVTYCDTTSIHPERPWMAYTPDALVTGERRGVDAKVVFWDRRKHWGPTADDIPQRVQLQCFWYMAALDYDHWDVCALVGEGEPRIYTLDRDPEVERKMLADVEAWHGRYLAGNEIPPVDNTPEAARWLQQAFPEHKRPDIREATDEERDLLHQYAIVRSAQSSLADDRAQLENKLKFAIGDREGLFTGSGKFTWRKTKDGTSTDWESTAIAGFWGPT